MSRNHYSEEFKTGAVRLMVVEGQSALSVSTRLGVGVGLLYKWKQQLQSPDSPEVLDMGELVAEVESLRKQLRHSEQINEILKKTVSYFSRDQL